MLVANADDPLLANLARSHGGPVRLFGVDDPRHARPSLQHAADSKYCPECGRPFVYAAAYVGHLGDYACPAGHLVRPPLDVAAREIELDGLAGARFVLATPDGSADVRLPLPGLYNVYNATAAAALAGALGVPTAEVVAGLESFSAAFGRFERIAVGDRRLLMLLVKNPAGANEAVRTLLEGEPPGLAVVALNDEIADGRDVSWIWDAEVELLAGRVADIVFAGTRPEDLALRFKYGSVIGPAADGTSEVVHDTERALRRAVEWTPAGSRLWIVPTYTAMLDVRDTMARLGYVRPYWEE
jgi:UDP-N-acetylmuramyl tripeptide synthase